MNDLKDLLQGAGEAKRQIFASEDFAGGYGRAIVSRVKRRRAVSATAMGGGTVVAVGALAVGAANVPWSGFVMGASPAGLPSVVCTTTTPDAMAESELNVPEGATVAVVDDASGEVVFVGWVDGTAVAWSSDGTTLPLAADDGFEGSARLQLPSGQSLVVRTEGGTGWVVPARASKVSVFSIEGYLSLQSSSVSVIAEDGTVLGRAIHISEDTLGFVADDKFYPLFESDGLTYGYVDDAGVNIRVTLVDNDPSSGTSAAPSTPVVTCVTTTPQPSESAPPSTTPSPAPSISAVPTTYPTVGAALGESPFQCGFEFSTEAAGSDGLSISSMEWQSAQDANTWIDTRFSNGDAPHAVGPYALRVTASDRREPEHGIANGAGFSSNGDPASEDEPVGMDHSGEAPAFSQGVSFVAVRDGVVVGTVARGNAGGPQQIYVDSVDGTDHDPLALLLDPVGAMNACPGVDLGAGWDTYVVAGTTYVYEDGSSDPVAYAWAKAPARP